MCDLSDLETEARIQLIIEDAANRIEYICADVLLPAPKGIYIRNRIVPVMIDNGKYFTITEIDGKKHKTLVTDITNVNEAIYSVINGRDECIIPKYFMVHKEKYISTEPFLPYRGIVIIKQFIENQINEFVSYRTQTKTPVDIMRGAMINIDIDALIDYAIKVDTIYEDIRQELVSFMGKRRNHLYFVKIKDTTLIVNQSIDYRAYQYMLLMEEKQKNDPGREYAEFGFSV